MARSAVESEAIVTQRIATHLQSNWPNALYNPDYGAGLKMTRGQAIKQARLKGRRGHPDLMIYEPRGRFIGLAVEIKRDGIKIFRRDGVTPVDQHIAEQMAYLGELATRGWYAAFGIGASDSIKLVDDYLSGKLEPESDQD